MKKVTISTAVPCPYCSRAKSFLTARGIAFEEIRLDWNDEKSFQELSKRSGLKTVPQIFADNECLGGCMDIEALDRQGLLLSKVGK